MLVKHVNKNGVRDYLNRNQAWNVENIYCPRKSLIQFLCNYLLCNFLNEQVKVIFLSVTGVWRWRSGVWVAAGADTTCSPHSRVLSRYCLPLCIPVIIATLHQASWTPATSVWCWIYSARVEGEWPFHRK